MLAVLRDVGAYDERGDARQQEQQGMERQRIKPPLPKPPEALPRRFDGWRKQEKRGLSSAGPNVESITHGTGCEKSIFACSSESVNSLGKRLQFLARFEAHGLPRRNTHFSARPGVTADTGLAGPDVKDTKATQFDAVASGEGFLHGVENGLDRDFRFGFGDASAIYHIVNDIQLYQTNLLKTLILS
ncbi:hypothetical protein SBA2_60032 [Acidobacteriia bacterium SbA2]|nr:hypothetical protein SBA2_60032 [Acidobacteriia bacterium SbA2]